MTENDSLRTINTFMLPQELQTDEECRRYIVLCNCRRDFMLHAKPKRYTIVVAAWNVRIAQAEARLRQLTSEAK